MRANVREHGNAGDETTLVDELALDVEEGAFGLVDEHDPLRLGPGELAAELGADRAARAGDEHRLPRDVRGDRVQVDLHRLAAGGVLDLHRADLVREVEIAGDQLVHPAGSSTVTPSALATSTIRWRSRRRLTGSRSGARPGRRSRSRCGSSSDVRARDPVQAQVLLPRIVVDQPIGV